MTLPCVSDGLRVPLVQGGEAEYVNLDLAASTPALCAVHDAVEEFLPWYSSVHRGTGFASMVATEAYEASRHLVRTFLSARGDDAIVFTRNTTDATNTLAFLLPEATQVVAFASEHHANLLPWRRRQATLLPPPASPAAALDELECFLRRRTSTAPALVAVTGASNVTGELWPIEEIVAVAHGFGARVLLDAAQLAPHRAIDMRRLDVDYLVLSSHKLYAPYGAGVLAGRSDWLANADPFLAGGGAVDLVTVDDVVWSGLPDRHEAGSPNVVGAVALGAACRALGNAGMDRLAAAEARLLHRLLDGLDALPGIERYSMWGPTSARIGVVTFTAAGIPSGLLAAALSAEHGIGVRHGCFCAHPLMMHLMQIDRATATAFGDELRRGRRPAMPGAVRASIGAPTSADHVERLLDALATIMRTGPRWNYRHVPGSDDYCPAPDTRRLPSVRALPGDVSLLSVAQPSARRDDVTVCTIRP